MYKQLVVIIIVTGRSPPQSESVSRSESQFACIDVVEQVESWEPVGDPGASGLL